MYQVPDQTGRRIVVTGSNRGTGKEAARRLAAAGAHVVLAVPDAGAGQAGGRGDRARHPAARLEVRRVDLADLASAAAFADGLLADAHPLDVLVNNAGVTTPPSRFSTADGFELQFGSKFRLGAEYHGAYHDERGQISKDRKRDVDAHRLGWRLLHVDSADLRDVWQLVSSVHTVMSQRLARD